MGSDTSIEWTDSTWNPVTGCDQISPGCAHCYAKTWAQRGLGNFGGGRPFEDVRCHDDRLDIPLHWQRPRRIFVNSMSDLFHDDVPDAFIDQVRHVMRMTPRHTYQILTKRPARMRAYTESEGAWSGNVWLGVSVENRAHAWRIRELVHTPMRLGRRFLSLEPLLEELHLTRVWWNNPVVYRNYIAHLAGEVDARDFAPDIDWVIIGGESGHGARPCDVRWIEVLVEELRMAGVPTFVKQLGARPVLTSGLTGETRPIRLYHRKGAYMHEWPEVLRVQQWPREEAYGETTAHV